MRHTDANADGNFDATFKPDTDSHLYSYIHTKGDADAESCTNTAASAYGSTAPVAFVHGQETHCSILACPP